MIAVCGIDCGSCDIRRAPDDFEAAQRIVAWYKKEGWLKVDEGIKEVIERSMYCKGVKTDRFSTGRRSARYSSVALMRKAINSALSAATSPVSSSKNGLPKMSTTVRLSTA